MFEFHDVQQNTDEWMALRLGKVTNSNAGTFMANLGKSFGDPAKRYALQIALEQLTGVKASAGFSNEHMERGHEQEPIARMLYQEETFSVVTNGGFFCHGVHGDSPDGLVGEVGGIEIKCVIAPVHYDTIRRGSFDPAYRWQLIGHLDCTGREWFDFVSYCADFPAASRLFTHRLYRRDYEVEIKQLQDRRAELLALVADIKADVSRVAA
jgi:hypothetical protein